MGQHGHYRVCINGVKDHSSGGYPRMYLDDWIKNHIGRPINEAYFGMSKTPDDLTDVVVLLFTRCNSGYRKRLDGILYSTKDKITGGNVSHFHPMKKYFDLRNPEEKEAYDKLGETYSPYNITAYGIC